MTVSANTAVGDVALGELSDADADLQEAAEFLHTHMNSRFSAAEWCGGLRACWLPDAPNHGFVLRAGGRIVGILCAVYSEQVVNGQRERFCNPHSWCVLEPYRKRSVDLVLAVIRQPGYHFTMFSPNADGIKIFGYLKFKPLDNSMLIMPHLPSPGFSPAFKVLTDEQKIAAVLPAHVAACFAGHKDISYLRTLVFGAAERYCLVIYKHGRYKRMRSAEIIYLSDQKLFEQNWTRLRSHLLLHCNLFVSSIERRLLANPPRWSFVGPLGPQKFFLSSTLTAADIQNTYSELVAMDL